MKLRTKTVLSWVGVYLIAGAMLLIAMRSVQ